MDKKIGIIDLGTNTLNTIIVAYLYGKYKIIKKNHQIIRLGEGIAKNQIISQKAIFRCIKGFKILSVLFREDKIKIIKCVGTSALREAKNSNEVIDLIFKRFKIKIEIISGREEAKYIIKANLNEFNLKMNISIFFDIGGGSTELIILKSEKIIFIKSIKLGSVTCTEGYMKTDPPKQEEIKKLENHIDRQLALIPNFTINLAVGTAGTITTLSAIKHRIEPYNSELIHKSNLSYLDIKNLQELFIKEAIFNRKKIKGLNPQRAEVILAGSIICERIMKKYNIINIFVSDKGLKHGLLTDMLTY